MGNNILTSTIFRKKALIIQLQTLIDLGLTSASFIGAYFIRNYFIRGTLIEEPNYYSILLGIIIIWYLIFRTFDVYRTFFDFDKDFKEIFWNIIKSVTTGLMILIFFLYLLKIEGISRLFFGIFYSLNLVAILFAHLIIFIIWKNFMVNEHFIYNIIIIGSKERARDLISKINSTPTDVHIVGCLDKDASMVGKNVEDDIKVIGTLDELKDILLSKAIDEVVFAMPLKNIDSAGSHLLLIEQIGVRVRIIPDWHIPALLYQPGIATIMFDNFYGIPTLMLATTSPKHRDLLIKNMFDIAISALILIIISPIFLLITIFIKTSSKGPVFFRQPRLGLNGRKFFCYKFRTMRENAEAKLNELKSLNEADGPVFKIKNDPRIIPFIGTILRKISLDELPQLINVFKGEMSLVGPRPPIPDEVKQYDIWQRRRLSMKPGITCLWQIAPKRNELSFKQWMELDLKYIDSWSLKLDFSILFRTFRAVVGAEGR